MAETDRFTKRFHIFLSSALFAIGLFIFIGGFYFNENYFLNYSPDKTLKSSTIESIHNLQIGLMGASLMFFLLVLVILVNRNKSYSFIGRHKKLLQNFTLLIIVVIIIFTASEIILRAIYKETTFAGGFGPGSLQFNKKYVQDI